MHVLHYAERRYQFHTTLFLKMLPQGSAMLTKRISGSFLLSPLVGCARFHSSRDFHGFSFESNTALGRWVGAYQRDARAGRSRLRLEIESSAWVQWRTGPVRRATFRRARFMGSCLAWNVLDFAGRASCIDESVVDWYGYSLLGQKQRDISRRIV